MPWLMAPWEFMTAPPVTGGLRYHQPFPCKASVLFLFIYMRPSLLYLLSFKLPDVLLRVRNHLSPREHGILTDSTLLKGHFSNNHTLNVTCLHLLFNKVFFSPHSV